MHLQKGCNGRKYEWVQREYLDTNALVFQTGDSGDAAYVIESGCVEILSGP